MGQTLEHQLSQLRKVRLRRCAGCTHLACGQRCTSDIGSAALAQISPGTAPGQWLLTAKRSSPSSTDFIVTTDAGPVRFRSYPEISNEQYRLYQQL